MVFYSPINNLRGFVSARPPLVVFTLCLMVFAVTTLSLAYYVEHTKEIQNTDVQRDWTSFLKYLSGLELCLSPADGPITSNVSHADMDTSANVTITVQASLKLSSLQTNITHIQGVLPISGWTSSCDMDVPQGIAVAFNISLLNVHNYSDTQNICVSITGPKSLLPATVGQKTCSTSNSIPGAWGRVTGRTTAALGEQLDFCTDGFVAKLSYVPNDRPLNIFLTVHDRSIINLHLVHTSYFLLVMAVTLVCYAIIKGKPKSKMGGAQQTMEKVPLDP